MYIHNQLIIQVGNKGIFSFSREFSQHILPTPFPSTSIDVFTSYLVAPYWSNIDTRLDGSVNYEVHVAGESSISDDHLRDVSSLINAEQGTDFLGNWMIVTTWDNVHPFPHGNSAEQDRVDPYLQSVCTSMHIHTVSIILSI